MTTREIYLERIDRAKNMARYYRLSICETLFGDYTLIREWGRIGRRGQSREEGCASIEQAQGLLSAHCALRTKRGYKAT